MDHIARPRRAEPLPPASDRSRRVLASLLCGFAVLAVLTGTAPASAALPPPPVRLAHIFDRPLWAAPSATRPAFPIVTPAGGWALLILPEDGTGSPTSGSADG